MLRLLAALVVPGVLHASAVLAALEGVVRSALQIAQAGEVPLAPRRPACPGRCWRSSMQS